jgi:hypothetical protein
MKQNFNLVCIVLKCYNAIWRSQFVTSNSDKHGLRYLPFCFTGMGLVMLSSGF